MALPIVAAVKRMAKSASVRIKLRPDKRFKQPKIKALKSDMQRLGEEIAEEFKETIIENIETNRYGYELSQSTIDRKGSDVPLVDSHQLVDAIYREGTTVSVEDTPRGDGDLTNLQLAIIQEYGTKDRHIPARPIWRDTFRDFESTAKRRVEEFLERPEFKHHGKNMESE